MGGRTKLVDKLTRHRLAVYLLTNLVALGTAVGLLVGNPSNTLHAIGEGLAAAAFTGGVLVVHFWLELKSDRDSEMLAAARITGVFEDRGADGHNFADDLREAQHSVDILAFGLRNLRERIYPGTPWPSPRAYGYSSWTQVPSQEFSYARQRAVEEETALEQNAIDVRHFVATTQGELLAAREEADAGEAGTRVSRFGCFGACHPSLCFVSTTCCFGAPT